MAKSSSIGGILITLVVLGGIGYGGYYFFQKKSTKDPEYSTVKAEKRQIIQSITASGNLQTLRTVDIGAQVSGLVLKVYKDFNDTVKEGELLVEIDPTTYQQKLNQAKADMESTEASYSITLADTERARELAKKNLITPVDLTNAEAKLIQANSSKLSRAAALKDAETNLERTVVRAPRDGIVLNRMVDEGKTVNATNSVPNLFTLVPSLDRLQIDAGVSEADIGNVVEGYPVQFFVDAYPGQQFNAQVNQVRALSKNTSGVVTYSVIIDVDNTARRLKPGMTANVSIIIAQRPADTLVVPNSTLRVRIPPEIESQVKKAGAPAAAANAPATKTLTPEERTAAEQEILAQSGLGRGATGAPTPDQIQKAQQLAKDKGLTDTSFIENAARGFGGRGQGGRGEQVAGGPGGGGRGGGRGAGGGGRGGGRGGITAVANVGSGQNVSSVPRTIYRLGTDAAGKKYPEALTITLGISDGQFTEVLDSGGMLQAGDALISYIQMPGAATQIRTGPAANNANPFGGQPQGGRGGGGGGGGGRGF